VQEAIWYFIGGGGVPSTDDGRAMVNDALTNGEGFVPTLEQTIVLILNAGDEVQLTVIELKRGDH
jgi:hypothetical protein